MAVLLADRFVAQCSPVISSNLATAGSITRASIAHLTATQLDSLFKVSGLFADLDAWFKYSIEMAACGVKRYALYDWIMANSVRGGAFKAAMAGTPVAKGPNLLHPFILAKTHSIVNRDYWKITCGCPRSGYTTNTTLGASACSSGTSMTGPLTVTGTGSQYIIRVESRYGMPMEANWFRLTDLLHIFGRSATGVTQHGQWKVEASAAASDLSYVDVQILSQNAGSSEAYDTTPDTGVILPGVNNVNDYESWAVNKPNFDDRKRVLFWYQTWRMARQVDSEYLAVYARLRASNRAFEEFGDLDMAQRNAQDDADEKKRVINQIFFGKPISANQTKDLWESLEAINSTAGDVLNPGMGGKIIARRANMVGIREQLRVCDQVHDLSNQKLNMYELFRQIYLLKRARTTSNPNRTVTDIDFWTNSFFAAQIQRAMFAYYKQESADQLRANVSLDQKITLDKESAFPITISFSSYPLVFPSGVRMNILVDEFFDDFRDQFADQSIESAGNLLLALDIGKPGVGSIYYAQLEANRKMYKTATIEELAKFDVTFFKTMKYLSQDVTLTSETGTTIVECPLNSLWIEGINTDVPIITGETSPVTDLY